MNDQFKEWLLNHYAHFPEALTDEVRSALTGLGIYQGIILHPVAVIHLYTEGHTDDCECPKCEPWKW